MRVEGKALGSLVWIISIYEVGILFLAVAAIDESISRWEWLGVPVAAWTIVFAAILTVPFVILFQALPGGKRNDDETVVWRSDA